MVKRKYDFPEFDPMLYLSLDESKRDYIKTYYNDNFLSFVSDIANYFKIKAVTKYHVLVFIEHFPKGHYTNGKASYVKVLKRAKTYARLDGG